MYDLNASCGVGLGVAALKDDSAEVQSMVAAGVDVCRGEAPMKSTTPLETGARCIVDSNDAE
jgi:hypothetical protein